MRDGYHVTAGAQIVVRLARWANCICLAALALALLSSFVFVPALASLVGHLLPGADVSEAAAGARWTILLGIVMACVTDRLLVTLYALIASAWAGDPFVVVNAGRLRHVGWCLLGLQFCELPGSLIARTFPAMGSAAPGGGISIAGWIAVLLVFVLARVFAVGAMMREDLDGTV